MPRQNERVGELAGFYLTKRERSPFFHATWFDPTTRQTKRASLGTENLREAEVRLAEFVTKHAHIQDQLPASMPLATVFIRYWHGHASTQRSHEAARYALALWTEHWGDASIAELTIQRQELFVAWLKRRGCSNSYVSRILAIGRAAVRRAWKRGEITTAPFIVDLTDRSDKREAYRLNKDEMRRLLSTVQGWPHLYIYCIIALNTLARPEAVLGLSPAQVRHSDQLIQLNPTGRRQTKKHRPVVPITDTVRPFLQRADVSRFVNWHGSPIKSIKKGFKTVVRAAGLPNSITPYSLRHTMAIELRKRGVPAWEVEGLLGHRRPGVTETYAEFAPGYLSKGREAIDAYFRDLKVSLPVPDEICVAPACHQSYVEQTVG